MFPVKSQIKGCKILCNDPDCGKTSRYLSHKESGAQEPTEGGESGLKPDRVDADSGSSDGPSEEVHASALLLPAQFHFVAAIPSLLGFVPSFQQQPIIQPQLFLCPGQAASLCLLVVVQLEQPEVGLVVQSPPLCLLAL